MQYNCKLKVLTCFKGLQEVFQEFSTTTDYREASKHTKEKFLSQIHEEENKIRDTLYNIKETVVTTGQGEQTVIVLNKVIDPTFGRMAYY